MTISIDLLDTRRSGLPGSDDGTWVWLNGQGVRRGAFTADSDGVVVHHRDAVGTHHEVRGDEAIVTLPFASRTPARPAAAEQACLPPAPRPSPGHPSPPATLSA